MENSKQSAFACASEYSVQKGLTKREYFAAMAMQGVLSNSAILDYLKDSNTLYLSERAVKIADEILDQLEK